MPISGLCVKLALTCYHSNVGNMLGSTSPKRKIVIRNKSHTVTKRRSSSSVPAIRRILSTMGKKDLTKKINKESKE